MVKSDANKKQRRLTSCYTVRSRTLARFLSAYIEIHLPNKYTSRVIKTTLSGLWRSNSKRKLAARIKKKTGLRIPEFKNHLHLFFISRMHFPLPLV